MLLLLICATCWVVTLWPEEGETAPLVERFIQHVSLVRARIRVIAVWSLVFTTAASLLNWLGISTRFNPFRQPEPLAAVLSDVPLLLGVAFLGLCSLPIWGSRTDTERLPDPVNVAPNERSVHQESSATQGAPDAVEGHDVERRVREEVAGALERLHGRSTLRVTVRDPDDLPARLGVVSVSIQVDQSTTHVASGRTDDEGECRLSGLPSGVAQVAVADESDEWPSLPGVTVVLDGGNTEVLIRLSSNGRSV